ncbi:MAG: hypothetical protein KJ621_05585 [Proteobacteria bacterium]|nr:hypothetical protein [Pseudomonadota bacterium]MBU1740820.1 hypothetical protein [Pseudomonadota bacterium]
MRFKCSDGRMYDTSDDLAFDERNLIQKLIILESVGAPPEKFEAIKTAPGSPLAPGEPATGKPSVVAAIARDLADRLAARTSDRPLDPRVTLVPFEDTYLGGGVRGEADDDGRPWLVFYNFFDQEVGRIEAEGVGPERVVEDWLARARRDASVLEAVRRIGVEPVTPP